MERGSKRPSRAAPLVRFPGVHVDRDELLAVFAGGALGAVARAALAQSVAVTPHSWPWATFAANLLAALLLGYFVTRLQERLPPHTYMHSLLGTGLCGALSTFSTMMLELRADDRRRRLEPARRLHGCEPRPAGSRWSSWPASSCVGRGSQRERRGAVARRGSAGRPRVDRPLPARRRSSRARARDASRSARSSSTSPARSCSGCSSDSTCTATGIC